MSPSVTTEDNAGATVTAPVTTAIGYDTFGAETESRDERGFVTTMRYDANGRPVEMVSPQYIAPGSTTPITRTVSRTYDAVGRVGSNVDAYHPSGQVASVTDPTGARTEATYDFLGRKATTTLLVRRTGSPTLSLTTSYTY